MKNLLYFLILVTSTTVLSQNFNKDSINQDVKIEILQEKINAIQASTIQLENNKFISIVEAQKLKEKTTILFNEKEYLLDEMTHIIDTLQNKFSIEIDIDSIQNKKIIHFKTLPVPSL